MDYVPVIIVGGGVAGLSAAKVLAKKVDFVLIEAQNYLGGRILTIDAAPNLTIDMGAQYVHGDKKNTVYDICEELGILLSDNDDSDEDDDVVTSDGKRIDSDLLEKANDFWERVREKAEDEFEDRDSSTPVSFGDYVPKQFRQRLQSSSSIPKDLIEPLIDYFVKLELTETSCASINDLNLVEYVAYEDLQGEYENDLKNGGYRPFINYLKSFIPNDNRVRLNCEVLRVKYRHEDQKLLVEMNCLVEQRRKQMICDHIIWTTSLGHLKKHFHEIFAEIPDLIQQKQNAIANLGFGTVNKVFLVYKKKFWSKKASSIVLLHTNRQFQFEMSDQLREQLQNERVDPVVFDEIVRMLFHYDVLPSTDIPVLICWFVGPAAIMMEKLSEQLVGQICHEVVCSFLRISWQKYPLDQVVRSTWNSNPYVRGSYSYYSIHSNKNDGKQLRAAFAPEGVPRILWAGEATHPGYYSTVNAAHETGIAAAKKVIAEID